MIKWPGGKSGADEIYHLLNEMYVSSIGGAYPVGKNGCWHSGIHIYAKEPVYPVTNGTLEAYRINEDYLEIESPKIITREEYEKLQCKDAYAERKDKYGAIYYERVDDSAKTAFSNGFMLIKHTFNLPATGGGGVKKIDFFLFI